MKATAFLVLSALSLCAQDIDFTNRVASFTNLEGQAYSKVNLVKGDLDGLVWSDANGGGGRICYTNLTPGFLEALGIPAERIDIARKRAQHKAVVDARYRARLAAEARLQLQAQLKARTERTTNATMVAQSANPADSNNYPSDSPVDPNRYNNYAPDYLNPYYNYAPYYPYVLGPVPMAASAPSAPSASAARSATSVPIASPGQSATAAQASTSVPIAAPTPPTRSAISAPTSGTSSGPTSPRRSR